MTKTGRTKPSHQATHALIALTEIPGHGDTNYTGCGAKSAERSENHKAMRWLPVRHSRSTKVCWNIFFFNPASFFLFTDTFAVTHVHTTFAHEGEAMKPYSTRTMADLCLCCVNLLEK